MIEDKKKEENLNSKKEFHAQTLKRLVIDKTDNFKCFKCDYETNTMKNLKDHKKNVHKKSLPPTPSDELETEEKLQSNLPDIKKMATVKPLEKCDHIGASFM